MQLARPHTFKPDHEHAPTFRVTYTVPANKAARDQAHQLRTQCGGHCAACLKRDAGEFTAWTEAEAIDAAMRAGVIPSSAENLKATKNDGEG